ncbi:MAG: metal-dependent hydrolase [Patescibacteria group bacterium]
MYNLNMTGTSHLITGTALGLAFISTQHTTPMQVLGATLVCAIASLLPDIDAENSTIKVWVSGKGGTPLTDAIISKRDRNGAIGTLLYALFGGIEFVIRQLLEQLITVVSKVVPHRGPTHYFITSFVVALCITILGLIFAHSSLYGIAFFIGYTAHILGDMCTHSGVTALKPFSANTYYVLPKFLRFKTEAFSLSEGIVVTAVVGIILAIIYL